MEIAPFYLLTLLAGILAAIFLVVALRRRGR
jgi:hypothetical protein